MSRCMPPRSRPLPVQLAPKQLVLPPNQLVRRASEPAALRWCGGAGTTTAPRAMRPSVRRPPRATREADAEIHHDEERMGTYPRFWQQGANITHAAISSSQRIFVRLCAERNNRPHTMHRQTEARRPTNNNKHSRDYLPAPGSERRARPQGPVLQRGRTAGGGEQRRHTRWAPLIAHENSRHGTRARLPPPPAFRPLPSRPAREPPAWSVPAGAHGALRVCVRVCPSSGCRGCLGAATSRYRVA